MQSLFESPPDDREFITAAKNVRDALVQLISSYPASIASLDGLRSYDYSTYSRGLNGCALGVGLYRQIEASVSHIQMIHLTRGLLLHDMGKCDIPRDLTYKSGALSEEEWRIMRIHPLRGYEGLKNDQELTLDSH